MATGKMYRYPNLQTHRQQAGLSMTKLAALAGVDRGLISRAERGGSHMAEKLYTIVNALNEKRNEKIYGAIDPEKEFELAPK